MPCSRSAASAKSISMMAFFFTMPISRMIPMMPIMSSSVPLINNASKAPTPADGKDAQHDVHGDHRGQDQPQRAGQRILERQRRALEPRLHTGR
ncbi:hypothetical protein G6F24_018577 [Rhizopus arrhizus]|nr:hypothetical protein G6F24_018577 [Rhizopus arrhizus]